MIDWTYASSGGLAFPVAFGDVWSAGRHRAKRHILACGDLEAGHADLLLDRHGLTPDLVYCDPPWNAALATGFRTKAGAARTVDFPAFLTTLMAVVRRAKRDVFLEMGRQHLELLKREIAAAGGTVLRDYAITYFGKNPGWLVHARFGADGAVPRDVTGMDDAATPEVVLWDCARPGDIVLNPSIGRGRTAIAAHRIGARFVGLELSPFRLSCTLKRLADAKCSVKREGTL
jgi:hypothetical protein